MGGDLFLCVANLILKAIYVSGETVIAEADQIFSMWVVVIATSLNSIEE